jgi:hypothetical protein
MNKSDADQILSGEKKRRSPGSFIRSVSLMAYVPFVSVRSALRYETVGSLGF